MVIWIKNYIQCGINIVYFSSEMFHLTHCDHKVEYKCDVEFGHLDFNAVLTSG